MKKTTKPITYSVDKDVSEQFDVICQEQNIDKNDWIAQQIEKLIKNTINK